MGLVHIKVIFGCNLCVSEVFSAHVGGPCGAESNSHFEFDLPSFFSRIFFYVWQRLNMFD